MEVYDGVKGSAKVILVWKISLRFGILPGRVPLDVGVSRRRRRRLRRIFLSALPPFYLSAV
jgi:hypothetical protein